MKTISKSVAVMMTLVSLVSVASASTPGAVAKPSGDYGSSAVHRILRRERHSTTPPIHRVAQVDSRRAYSPETAPTTHSVISHPVANPVQIVPSVGRHTMNVSGNHDAWALMTRDAGSKMSGNY